MGRGWRHLQASSSITLSTGAPNRARASRPWSELSSIAKAKAARSAADSTTISATAVAVPPVASRSSDDDSIAGPEGVDVGVELVGAVLELVVGGPRRPWQPAR